MRPPFSIQEVFAMKHSSALLLALIVIIAISGAFDRTNAQEKKKFAAKDLPAAVSEAFTKAYPKAVITGIDKEVENGKTFYEIESLDGTMKRDLLYTPEGTVTEIDEALSAEALPEAVKKAIAKEFPTGTIRKAEKATHGVKLQYDVVVNNNKKMYEASVGVDGKILSKKEITAKSEKEEKEDDEENEEKK